MSPRKIIRHGLIESWGFPYADCFNIENKLTLEQSNSEPFKTTFKFEYRLNIIKPIRFIQSFLVKETEKQLRDGIEGKYKETLEKMMVEL